MAVRNIYGKELAYTIALARGGVNPTGQAIRAYLNDPARPFDVVVTPQGSTYGQMMVENDPVSEESERARDEYFKHTRTRVLAIPTLFWCPDYTFVYYGDVSGIGTQVDGTLVPKRVNQLVAGDYLYRYSPRAGLSIDVPVVRYTRSEMPPWVVLYHELGHMKQYYEGTPAVWTNRLLDTNEIEADNLARHENPICNAADIAVRAHYKHMANGFSIIASSYAVPNKAPALRVSSSRLQRGIDDAALAALVAANAAATGFFRRA